jgi:hypothetical protein
MSPNSVMIHVSVTQVAKEEAGRLSRDQTIALS